MNQPAFSLKGLKCERSSDLVPFLFCWLLIHSQTSKEVRRVRRVKMA